MQAGRWTGGVRVQFRRFRTGPLIAMSMIDVRQAHSLTPEQARSAVDAIAGKLAQRFDVASRWDGDVLVFSRSGVDGRIELQPQAIRVTAELGFLLSAMSGTVESEIRRVLAEKLG